VSKGDGGGVATQKDSAVEVPGLSDLHPVGTYARVAEILRLPTGDYRIALEALGRFTLRGVPRTDPFWVAEGETVVETRGDSADARLFARALAEHVKELPQGSGLPAPAGDPA